MKRAIPQIRRYATAVEPRPYSEMPRIPSVPILGALWTLLPVVGTYSMFLSWWHLSLTCLCIGTSDRTRFHHSSMKLYRQYGPVVAAEIGTYRSMVHLFNPKDIENVFRLEGRYPNRTFADVFQHYREKRKEMFPNPGLFVLQGPEWWKLRSKVQKDLLLPERVYSFVPSMDQVACEFLELLESQKDPVTLEIPELVQEFYKWALESMAAALQKIDPEQQLYTPKIVDIAAAVIEMYGDI
ncbi:CYP302A1 [Cordylochernes scorpioides]|uniref:CYP302A1 n=1 Tax=Cordylochernes scorpioides TaxID=51811 RepID=A0ABY6KR01_9ARAC|nr:CYP302A1 [Cordylochernes scorpioides]